MKANLIPKVLELTVKHNLKLESNIVVLENGVAQRLKDYDIVVTTEGVKEAKNLMADLNREKKAIQDRWKQTREKLILPIATFDGRISELGKKYDLKRGELSEQVDAIEEGKRNLSEQLCHKYMEWKADNVGLNELPNIGKFSRNLTNLNERDELTNQTKTRIDSTVNGLLAGQLKLAEEKRLGEEAEKRQVETIKQRAVNDERERQKKEDEKRERQPQLDQAPPEIVKPQPESIETPSEVEPKSYKVVVEFELPTHSQLSREDLKARFNKHLKENFKTFKEITGFTPNYR